MHVDLAALAAEHQPNSLGTNPQGANPQGANPQGASPQGASPQGASDYAELKRRILALGLLKRQPGYYVAKFAITGGLLAAGVLALVVSPNDPWLRLAEAAFLAFVIVQIGLLAHDLAHQ